VTGKATSRGDVQVEMSGFAVQPRAGGGGAGGIAVYAASSRDIYCLDAL